MEVGIVIRSTGSFYQVRMPDGKVIRCRIVGKFRLQGLKLTNPVAVGDKVSVMMENEEDGLIKKIGHRDNYVVRQSPRQKHNLHLLASNIDQSVLIVSMTAPKLKQGFIDRFLLMMEPQDIPTIIVFNKRDLYSEEDFGIFAYFEDLYQSIGYDVMLVSAAKDQGIDALKEKLKDKTTLMSGQSGVGKSTIMNALQPQMKIRTLEISDYTGKGQHTTTFAEMYPLSFGGYLIDTPGIKTLAFNNLEPMDVSHNFREFFELSSECKFKNCTHRDEPKCAVKAGLEDETISDLRYANYLQILEEIEDLNYWERHKDM